MKKLSLLTIFVLSVLFSNLIMSQSQSAKPESPNNKGQSVADTTKKKIIDLLPEKVNSDKEKISNKISGDKNAQDISPQDSLKLKDQIPNLNLTGQIVDSGNGETLLGANIYLKDNIQMGTTTDLEGNFKLILNSKYKNDTVVVSYLGYQKMLLPVNSLLSGNVTIKMNPEGKLLQGVTIRGQRLVATEFTKQTIKKIDIYLNPSAKDDPILAVKSSPSATTVNETAEVNFRGSPSRETGIFLNDVPVYDAVKFEQDNNIGTFSIFSTDMVNQVLVFPSNPPLEYGNVSSGLIALTTQNQVNENNRVINAGISQVGALVAQKLGKKASFTAQGRYQFSGLMKEINKVAYDEINSFGSGDGSFNFYFEPNDHNRFKYYAYYDYEDYNIDINDPTLSADTRYNKTNFFQIGNYTYERNNSAFRLNFSQGFNERDFKFGSLDVKQRAENFYGSTSYTWYFPGSNTLKIGVDGEARKAKLNGTVPATSSYDPNAPSVELDSILNLNRLEGYFYGKVKLANWLEFGAGLRSNVPTEKKELSYLSGQANFKFNLTDNQNIKLGVGQYFRVLNPTVIQFYRNEFRSRQASIDYQLKGSNFLISLGVYYKYNTDLYAHDDYQIYGFEGNYQQQIGKYITSDVNLSQVNAEKVNQPKYSSNFNLGYLLKHSLKVDLTHGFNLGTSLLYREGIPYTPILGGTPEEDYYLPIYGDTNSMRYPDYFKLDLNVSKIFSLKNGDMFVLYFVLNNVTDRKNIDSYYYNRNFTIRKNKFFSRRSVYFGVQFQF
ncbi:MAG: carboxypeptidase-like regulatory domain-containing protein [Bacteroidales bacterium]